MDNEGAKLVPDNSLAWLNTMTEKYTPTTSEFDAARGHRSAIETRLDSELGVKEMFEIGSLKHGTGVWYYSDADFLVSLKGSQPGSPTTMLNNVKTALQGRFQSTDIVIRRPAVVCKFSDGDVEIVPAYESGTGYQIASPIDGWMLTHPKNHNTWVNGINNNLGGNVKRLARQLKVWKYTRNVPVSSCYLEMRTAQYMNTQSSYAALHDLHAALKHIEDAGLAAMNDPTGLGSRFTACSSDSNRRDTLSKLSTAVGRARSARDYAKLGYESLAIDQLKLLFNQ